MATIGVQVVTLPAIPDPAQRPLAIRRRDTAAAGVAVESGMPGAGGCFGGWWHDR